MSLPVKAHREGTRIFIEAHHCRDLTEPEFQLPQPPWHIDDLGYVRPSVNCSKCGMHGFAYVGFDPVNEQQT